MRSSRCSARRRDSSDERRIGPHSAKGRAMTAMSVRTSSCHPAVEEALAGMPVLRFASSGAPDRHPRYASSANAALLRAKGIARDTDCGKRTRARRAQSRSDAIMRVAPTPHHYPRIVGASASKVAATRSWFAAHGDTSIALAGVRRHAVGSFARPAQRGGLSGGACPERLNSRSGGQAPPRCPNAPRDGPRAATPRPFGGTVGE